jgi:hypothetical protein
MRSPRSSRPEPALSRDLSRRRHATMRSTSGISQEHSRNTSGVQATRCSSVPRFFVLTPRPLSSTVLPSSHCTRTENTHPRPRDLRVDVAHLPLPSRPIEPPLCQEYTVVVKVLTIADDAFRKSRRHKGERPAAQVAAGNLSHRPARPAGQPRPRTNR